MENIQNYSDTEDCNPKWIIWLQTNIDLSKIIESIWTIYFISDDRIYREISLTEKNNLIIVNFI